MRLPVIRASLFSFKSLYVAFFAAVVFYGRLRLMFGLTPRHIAIIVMLIACLRSGVSFPMGRIMKAYFLFVLAFIVSAFVTGYIKNVLITYYVAACIGYWATKILIIKYNDGHLLLRILIALGVLNAVVTIGQMLGQSFADQLVSFFRLTLPEKYIEKMDQEGSESMALLLTRPGLFSSAVYNGYFHMTAGAASLVLIASKFQPLRLIPWILIVLGCICVQERGPIIILSVLSAVAFYKTLFLKKYAYVLFVLVFAFVVYSLTGAIDSVLPHGMDSRATQTTYMITDYDDSSSESQAGYSRYMKESRFAELGLDETGRGDIYDQATDYLIDHPFLGGYHRLARTYGMAPHNLFLNAFIYGGFVGGIAILFILLWQIKPLWRVLTKKIERTNPVCFFAGLAYVAFTLNSFVHNKSIVTGDEMLWMLWALFYYEYRKYHRRPIL